MWLLHSCAKLNERPRYPLKIYLFFLTAGGGKDKAYFSIEQSLLFNTAWNLLTYTLCGWVLASASYTTFAYRASKKEKTITGRNGSVRDYASFPSSVEIDDIQTMAPSSYFHPCYLMQQDPSSSR